MKLPWDPSHTFSVYISDALSHNKRFHLLSSREFPLLKNTTYRSQMVTGTGIYMMFSDFLLSETFRKEKGWWSIATWSTWLTKIKITSRQNPPHKPGGQNQSYHPHRKYQEVSVTVTFVWTMSVYTPRSLTCSPWKVSIPQKQYSSYHDVSSTMSSFRGVNQTYSWKLALPLHFPGTNDPRGHKSLDVTNTKTFIVNVGSLLMRILGASSSYTITNINPVADHFPHI